MLIPLQLVMLPEGLLYMGSIQGSHTICGALPDHPTPSYRAVALRPEDRTVGLVLSANAPLPSESAFCAQYDLVPRVVVIVQPSDEDAWSALQRFPLIVDAPDSERLVGRLRALARSRPDVSLQTETFPQGLRLLRLSPSSECQPQP